MCCITQLRADLATAQAQLEERFQDVVVLSDKLKLAEVMHRQLKQAVSTARSL